jgi:hypothetical protein
MTILLGGSDKGCEILQEAVKVENGNGTAH